MSARVHLCGTWCLYLCITLHVHVEQINTSVVALKDSKINTFFW